MKRRGEMTVFISHSDRLYDDLFQEVGWRLVGDAGEADLICFTGGSDVSASIYGDKSHPRAFLPDLARDLSETALYDYAITNKKSLVGICRGAQLLCALNRGKLVQHMNGHGGGSHEVITLSGGDGDSPRIREDFLVTSSHHQMMLPDASNAEVILVSSKLSGIYELDDVNHSADLPYDIEGVFWEKTRSLGVQYHPEWMEKGSRGRKWFHEQVESRLFN